MTEPAPIPAAPSRRDRRAAFARPSWAALFVAACTGVAAGRLLHLIDLHAVDLLYWDQWTLYQAIADGVGPWELFRWQHGPHRQGVGFWVTRALADWSGWNTRVEATAVGLVVCASTGLALWLRRRIGGPLHPGDAAIPLLLLTPAQYGIFLHTPNLSHGAVPVLLLLLACLAFAIPARRARYGTLVLLAFALVHTGFGIFAGAIAPFLLALLAIHERRAERAGLALPAAALLLSLASVALFFIGLRTEVHASAVLAPSPPLAAHLRYVSLMFANVLGLKGLTGVPVLVGAGVAALAVGVALEQTWRLLRADPGREASLAILALLSFTLVYALATALGRVPLGMPGAQTSRYVPLMAPAFLGLYLRGAGIRAPRRRHVALAASALAMGLATIPMRTSEAAFMHHLSRGKRLWVETYLETGDVAAANARAGLVAFPHDGPEFPRILAHARKHGLGFFARR